MDRIVYHLVHKSTADKAHPDRWYLEEDGHAVAEFDSKDEGEEEGRRRGRRLRDAGRGVHLVVHHRDGSVDTEYTYGHTPHWRAH